MTSLFQGTRQARHYAACRPTYPKALYDLIASKCLATIDGATASTTTSCIDVGCGTGQATVSLAEYFDSVTGIDPSPTQLQEASKHPKVAYHHATFDEYLSTLPAESIQCITVAQAVHWFDLDRFYSQVHRVLQPKGGVLALWTYGLPDFPNRPNDDIERQLYHIYEHILGDYWDPRRKLVDDLYQNIPLIDDERYYPGLYTSERIGDLPTADGQQRRQTTLDIEQEVSGAQIKGYVRSWSAYTKYCTELGIDPGSEQDPVEQFLTDDVLGETETTLSHWRVVMLISVKH